APSGLRAGSVARLLDLDPFATCVDDWVFSTAVEWDLRRALGRWRKHRRNHKAVHDNATSASGNGSLGSFLPRGVSAGIPRKGHLKAPQPMRRQLALWSRIVRQTRCDVTLPSQIRSWAFDAKTIATDE